MSSEYYRAYYAEHKQEQRDRQNAYYLRKPKKYILMRAKKRASKLGRDFDITEDDFELPTHCPVLGIELAFNLGKGSGGHDNSYCLDRIDNSKGYVKGNVMIISTKANRIKGDATPEELQAVANFYAKLVKEAA